MVAKWKGNYFDGKSAVSQKVEIQHVSEGILIEFADGRMRIWRNYEFRLKQDRLQGPIRLEYGEFTPEIIEVEDPSFQEGIIEKNLKRPRYLSIWLALFAILLIPSIIYLGIPAASEWFVRFVPVSIEEKLGDYVVNELFPDRQICQAEAGRKALDEMVMRLTTKEFKYNFKIEVVDSDLVNAIAFPGGNILIFRGLLEISPSADGFAGVLAHEMQHVLHRHGTVNILRQTALSGIFKLLYGDAGTFAKTFFDGIHILSILRYTRELEEEADESALMLLIKNGIDPAAMIEIYKVLSKHSSSIPEEFSTHPDMSSRLERLKTLIQQEPEFKSSNVLKENNWKSLQNICQS